METLQFTTVLEEQKVKLDSGGGVVKEYTLKELTGPQREDFLDNLGTRLRYGDNGKPQGLKKHRGLQASLLKMCLYGDDEKLVAKDFLDTLPTRTIEGLFKAAQTISGLNEDGAEEAKND